jgi:HSP20 family molecular chaperone IbpA
MGWVYDALAQPPAVLQSMSGVSSVSSAGEDVYRVALNTPEGPREIELAISAKVPFRRFEWRTGDGAWSGAVTLEPLGPERTAVVIAAESASDVSPPEGVVEDALQELRRALQSVSVRIGSSSDAGSSHGRSGSTAAGARRYASEWRDAAQSAFARPTEFPFKLMRTISRQMDRVWGDVLRGTPISRLPQIVPGMPWNPDVEVCEQHDQVRVCIDVPGVEESHLQVEIDDGALVVHGERQDERESDIGHRRSELHYGSFTRRIPLPQGVDPDGARALLRNGVLEVRVPFHRREPKRIPVQHAAG